jgi:protein gp37
MTILIENSTCVRFLSLEPLLEPVTLSHWFKYLDWVIVGGESGTHARPMNLDWARQIIQQCQKHNVPVFVKQLGTHWAKTTGTFGKESSKGENVELWPQDLRVQEYPEVLYRAHSKNGEPEQLYLF